MIYGCYFCLLLQAENSALALENESQREQYERCLDEVRLPKRAERPGLLRILIGSEFHATRNCNAFPKEAVNNVP